MDCSSEPGTAELKREARRRALKMRSELGPEARGRASAAICARLEGLPEYESATTVMGFAPMAEEVDITPFLRAALGAGKRLLLPRVDPQTRRIRACEVVDLERDLEPGFAGILEPRRACAAAEPREIDFIAVPAAAVGEDLSRLGYGGGFYDRFLSSAPQAFKVAVVFSAQRLRAVPVEAHDMQVDRCLDETDSQQ